MYVCICNGVTDKTIKQAVRDGADSVEIITLKTGAGNCCGGCKEELSDILNEQNKFGSIVNKGEIHTLNCSEIKPQSAWLVAGGKSFKTASLQAGDLQIASPEVDGLQPAGINLKNLRNSLSGGKNLKKTFKS